jgi:hypothetical protein
LFFRGGYFEGVLPYFEASLVLVGVLLQDLQHHSIVIGQHCTRFVIKIRREMVIGMEIYIGIGIGIGIEIWMDGDRDGRDELGLSGDRDGWGWG